MEKEDVSKRLAQDSFIFRFALATHLKSSHFKDIACLLNPCLKNPAQFVSCLSERMKSQS